MPRPSLEQIRALGNFTQLFRWNIEFEQAPQAVLGVVNDDLNYRADSVDGLPKIDATSVEILIRGHKKKQVGIADYGNTITIVFFETTDNKISVMKESWENACWDKTGGSTGTTANQKELEGTLVIIRLNNLDEPIARYKLIGCYPEAQDAGGTLDGATADPLKPSMTFSFDRYEFESLV